MADSFAFEFVSPEKLLLSGDALEVQIPGMDGEFVVMAHHAPVMSTIKPGVVDVKMADGENTKFFVRGGFADVSANGLTVLAEYAVNLEDLDLAEIDQHITNLKEDVADADTDEKRNKAQAALDQLIESHAALVAAGH
ncbi:MAG: F0F1 ATP synthase subunit epsilon [Rhizobiaceae bacterium]|nr:F0F1 ATP synthase subunit epsilon [Rhizobiaceae bacterium]